jgi:chromosome segregation ATPase
MTTDETGHSTVPASVRAKLVELTAERSLLLAERERLISQVRAADNQAREFLRAQDTLSEQVRVADELRDRLDEASEARVELDALRRERNLARDEVSRLRAERDQLRMDLLRAELMLGQGEAPASGEDFGELHHLRARVAELAAHGAHLQHELDAHQATVSWRVTAPLRAVRRKAP